MNVLQQSSAEVLAQWQRGDRTALEQVVAAQAPMVFNTCLRILGERSDAEDATQAVFLTLVRKAARLPAQTALGPWLHGVAVLTARAQRRAQQRRQQHERRAVSHENKPSSVDSTWEVLKGELDGAIAQLPRREREVIVQLYLQGSTRDETAAVLRVPAGTVASRASRGLQRLREHFSTQLPSLSTGALSTLMSVHATSVPLSAQLSALSASTLAAVAPATRTISEEVLRQMFIAKIKALSGMAAALLLLAGGVFVACRGQAGESILEKNTPPQQSWGEAVNGLAALVRLDRTSLPPGKRLEAELFLRNTGDKPLLVLLPKLEMLGWDVQNAAAQSCATRASVRSSAQGQNFLTEGRVQINPQQTVLLLIRRLEPCFDFVADGQYKVCFEYKLDEAALGNLPERKAIWTELQQAGIWSGTLKAKAVSFEVSGASQNFVGETREHKMQVTHTGAEIRIASLSGDSSDYQGQAALLIRNHAVLGRLRLAQEDGKGWLLTPIAPLKAEEVVVGDSVALREESYSAQRPGRPHAPGADVGGLKATLSSSQAEYKADEVWDCKVELQNTGNKQVRYCFEDNALYIAPIEATPAAKVVVFVGSGMDVPIPPEERVHELPAAQRQVLFEFGRDPYDKGNLGGYIGPGMLGFQLKPGAYDVAMLLRTSAEYAYHKKLKDVWLGSLETNVIRVKVNSK